VPDEYYRTTLCVDNASRGRDISRQRDCRILNDGDVVAILAQQVEYSLPPGSIDESTVHEHD
jgi:hypothetical protein